jgi:hypothetical protein
MKLTYTYSHTAPLPSFFAPHTPLPLARTKLHFSFALEAANNFITYRHQWLINNGNVKHQRNVMWRLLYDGLSCLGENINVCWLTASNVSVFTGDGQ